MPGPIVVLGSVNMDLVLRCPRLPAAGETLHGHDFRSVPGGKGANQAEAAARLGGAVHFIGCVGDDAFGREARAALQAEGIGTTHLHTVAGHATGIAMIFVDAAGRNCIGLSGGANDALGIAEVDAAAGLIAGAALLVCQLETPLAVVQHAIALARRSGVPVLLNPAPAQALPADLAPQVDWLVPNQPEAALLAGLADSDDAAEAARRLAAAGYRTVIVTVGEQGVSGIDAGRPFAFRAPRVRPVDTTGAGDTFVGALAVAIGEGLALADAVAFAQRAAAISVTREGAMASMPRRDALN